MSAQSDIHSCSYYCDRPECIKAQRDELRERQLSAQGAGLADEAISVADIEKEISHIQQNGINLAKFGGEEVHEGRCRELCAMYLREFVIAHRMMGKLASLRAPAANDAKLNMAFALINKAISVLQQQIIPDGISDHEALCELHGIFDGPEYRAMLSAAPSSPAERGWQPIETAPYDKTMVALLFVDGTGYARYGVGWYMPLTGWQGWNGDKSPTHWMPLPAAPVTITEDGR